MNFEMLIYPSMFLLATAISKFIFKYELNAFALSFGTFIGALFSYCIILLWV